MLRAQVLPEGQKVSLWEKIALVLGSGGTVYIQVIYASFTMYFLTDVLRVGAAAAGTMLIVSTIVEIILTPFMGKWLDGFRSRWGQARPVILISNILTAVFAVLLFTSPGLDSGLAKLAWAYFAYIGLSLCMTLARVASSLLPARIAGDRVGMTEVNSKIYLGGVLMSIVATATVMGLLTFFSGAEGDMGVGYHRLAIFAAAVLIVESVILFLVKERGDVVSQEGAAEVKSYSTWEAIKVFFRNRNMVGFCLMTLLVLTAYYVSANTLLYYCMYNLNNPSLYTPLAVIDYGATVVATLTLPYLVKKYESRGIIIVSLLFGAFGYIVRYITGDTNVFVMCAFACIASMAIGFYNLEFVPVVMDCSVYSEYKDRVKIEGFFMALFMLIMKVSQGLGGSVVGFALSAIQYVEGAETQTLEVVKGLKVLTIGVLSVAMVIGCLIFALTFNLKSKDVESMQEEIRLRG